MSDTGTKEKRKIREVKWRLENCCFLRIRQECYAAWFLTLLPSQLLPHKLLSLLTELERLKKIVVVNCMTYSLSLNSFFFTCERPKLLYHSQFKKKKTSAPLQQCYALLWSQQRSGKKSDTKAQNLKKKTAHLKKCLFPFARSGGKWEEQKIADMCSQIHWNKEREGTHKQEKETCSMPSLNPVSSTQVWRLYKRVKKRSKKEKRRVQG